MSRRRPVSHQSEASAHTSLTNDSLPSLNYLLHDHDSVSSTASEEVRDDSMDDFAVPDSDEDPLNPPMVKASQSRRRMSQSSKRARGSQLDGAGGDVNRQGGRRRGGDVDEEDEVVTLVSNDGFSFVVRRSAVLKSEVMARMLDRTNNFQESITGIIKLDLLSGPVLEEVCKYLYFAERNKDETDVPDPEIPTDMCLELLVAADYLKC